MIKEFNSPVVSESVLIFNDKGQIILTNPGADHLFSYTSEEILGKSIEELIPGGLELIQQNRHKVSLYESSSSANSRIKLNGVKKDRNEFSMEIGLSQFEGKKEFFTVAFISEIPGQLKYEEESFKKRASPFIYIILNPALDISMINSYGCELLGSTEVILKGMNWFKNFLPDEDKHKLIFEQACAKGTTGNYESPVFTFKGEQHTIYWTTYTIYNSEGVFEGTLNAGIDSGRKTDAKPDIDHVKKIKKLNKQLKLNVEQQTQKLLNLITNVETINQDLQLQIQKRKEIEQKLIKFQRLYDTMVHNFPDGVIGVLNREMEYILIDGKDLNKIDLPALGLMGPKLSGDQDSALAEETISKIKKAFDGENISFEVKAKDHFYHISAVPLPDTQNDINEILCVLKDITVKNQMEEGLLIALAKEKELGELKSRFVTMACHEFKTPLATILSSAFLLENYSGKDFEKEKSLHTNRIKRSVNNLTLILNEFLSLEKLDRNNVKPVNTTINIPKYIKELISEIEPFKEKGRIFDYQHYGDQCVAYLDQHMLWSILNNLISNAIKYSKKTDPIDLTSEIKDDQIIITVKDNGIGIPAEEHKNIFSRFFRARNALNFEGTGLGLHIVEKNVKLLRGSISFTSTLDTGTEFTVMLPYESDPAMETELLKNKVYEA